MSTYSPGDVQRVAESGQTLKIIPDNIFEQLGKEQEQRRKRAKEVMKLLKEKWTDRTQPPPLHLFRKNDLYSKTAIRVAQTVWKQYEADRKTGSGKHGYKVRIDPDTYGKDPDQLYIVPQDKGAQFTYDGINTKYISQGEYYNLRDPKNTNVLLKPQEFLEANDQLLNPVKHANQEEVTKALNNNQQTNPNPEVKENNQPTNPNPDVKENGDLNQGLVIQNTSNKTNSNKINYPSNSSNKFPSKTVDDVSQFKKAATTSWSRNQGSLKTRNEQTIAYWDSKYEGISNARNRDDLARALRTGEAWETGKGTIIYQPDRGVMQVYKARPDIRTEQGPNETLKEKTYG